MLEAKNCRVAKDGRVCNGYELTLSVFDVKMESFTGIQDLTLNIIWNLVVFIGMRFFIIGECPNSTQAFSSHIPHNSF